MKRRWQLAVSSLVACAALHGCSLGAEVTDFESDGLAESSAFGEEQTLGAMGQALAACAGDDAVYDFNAFAASLAVAVANELGRWDVTGDFQI